MTTFPQGENFGGTFRANAAFSDTVTILKQPVAFMLDARTLSQLGASREPVRFTGSLPLGEHMSATVQSIRPSKSVCGEHLVGVQFTASGPFTEALTARAAVHGMLNVTGIAYYSQTTSQLVSVRMVLRIRGNAASRAGETPISVVSQRLISLRRQ